jgi:ABC-type tungstate transport system permease subunit
VGRQTDRASVKSALEIFVKLKRAAPATTARPTSRGDEQSTDLREFGFRRLAGIHIQTESSATPS